MADAFSLTFVWLDPTGTPGAQPYSIYNSAFETIESGTTVPAASGVPIPAPAALMAIGLVGLAGVRRGKI